MLAVSSVVPTLLLAWLCLGAGFVGGYQVGCEESAFRRMMHGRRRWPDD